MADNQTYRIIKVASELGVAVGTLAEHLKNSGFDVDNKPTTKISQEMYDLLLRDFRSDKAARDEAKQLEMNKMRDQQEVTEISHKPKGKSKQDEDNADFEDEVVLIKNTTVNPVSHHAPKEDKAEEPKTPELKTPEVKKEEPKKEETPKTEPETKKEPEVPAQPTAETQKPEPEAKPEVEKPQEEEKGARREFKVIGKVDLSSIKNKTRPDKKKAKQEPVEKPKPVEEKKPAEKPVAKADEAEKPKQEEKPAVKPVEKTEPKAEEKTPPAEKEIKTETPPPAKEKIAEEPSASEEDKGVVKPNYEKLQGLRVLGKIDLPANQPRDKKPVASSDGSHEGKKKRKRKPVPATERPKTGGDNKFPPRTPRPAVDRRGGRTDQPKEITGKEIQDKLKQTLARLQPGGGKGTGGSRSKMRRQKRDEHARYRQDEQREMEAEKKVLKVTEFISANELARMMDLNVTDIITACFSLGMMVSINQRLDAEAIAIIADEFGYETQFVGADVQEAVEEETDDPEDLEPRSPIVTVMGHVDHGKTSLLDHIRKANVIAGEAGGITQHIGAYEVLLENEKTITFLDTPGHEAFTAMRARGAKITDVAIIVVAADDSVMPQTKEAISHAQAAGVPLVFAINKIDKDGANPDKVREQLAAMDILVEEWGGKYQCQEISAKKGLNIDALLDKVLLEAEMLELKANPNKRATGSVIEAQLDKGRGIVVTLMVQGGTLRMGDPIIAGVHYGKVKAMFNERGKKIEEAGPSTPVTVLGFNGAPQAGDKFQATATDADAKDVSNKRQQLLREQGLRTRKHITLDEIGRRLAIGNFKELNVIIKGDVDGSVEALSDAMQKLSTQEIQINVIHKSVGQISESDVLLASASDAIIVGFQVRPSIQAKRLAETEGIEVKYYSVIYKAIEELKDAMEGMLEPDIQEKELATVEVREVFKITKVGTVAGCYVLEGKIFRNSRIRLIRDGVVMHTGTLDALKRFKDDVKEVNHGYECGISIKNWSDIQVGDMIEAFEEIEVKRKLK